MAEYKVTIQQMRLEEVIIDVAATGRQKAGHLALGLARLLPQKHWTPTDITDEQYIHVVQKQE